MGTHSLHSLIPGYHRSHSFSTTSNVQYLIPTVFLIPTPTITIKMRSFAVVAGFAAVALAAPQYEAAYPAASSAAEYPSYPVESSSAPAYEAPPPLPLTRLPPPLPLTRLPLRLPLTLLRPPRPPTRLPSLPGAHRHHPRPQHLHHLHQHHPGHP